MITAAASAAQVEDLLTNAGIILTATAASAGPPGEMPVRARDVLKAVIPGSWVVPSSSGRKDVSPAGGGQANAAASEAKPNPQLFSAVRGGASLAVSLVSISFAATAAAQGLPSEPLTFGDGRVIVGADMTATIAPEDTGYFNYTDYEYSALRNFRIGVTTEVRATDRLQFLAEVRVDQLDNVQAFAWYARIRPWPTRRFDIQIGRVPPTFGAMGRRPYGPDNMLIGQPLAYQYLTSLRPDSVATSADDLLAMRGRGWLANYSAGSVTPEPGVPLINAFRWDTGVQVHGKWSITEWTGSVTSGTLANPRVDDDNDGRQIAGRVRVRPLPALALGVSGARGAFLSRTVAPALPSGFAVEDGTQRAWGVDAEYSFGRFLARSETIWSRWTMPVIAAPYIDHPLDAVAVLVEGRYRLLPGVHAAIRGERLEFNRVTGSTRTTEWEAPVQRLEVGGGWSIWRNLTVKASWQHNRRDGGRVRRLDLGAVQLSYWF